MPTATLCANPQGYVTAFAYHTSHKIKSWRGSGKCMRDRTTALLKNMLDGTAAEKCPHTKTAKICRKNPWTHAQRGDGNGLGQPKVER